MAISQATKDLIADGIWATDDTNRETPEDAGIVRADGWNLPYEQVGSGRYPERTVFNQLHHENTSAIIDVFAYGIPCWSPLVSYQPAAGMGVFVTTASGLHVSTVPSGPASGNPTDPDQDDERAVWRMY